MSTELLGWLDARNPAPPAPLAQALRAAVAPLPADQPHAAALVTAAVTALRRALALGEERAAAWELLTADALFSYAIEAAAEQGSETLAALVDTWNPAAFARLIEPRT